MTSENNDEESLRAPFIYAGGKRPIASAVWARFGGNLKQYIEPFCGSAAMLLASPSVASLEVVSDTNGFIANFWRAVKHQPGEVARWADWPVVHCCPAGTRIAAPGGDVSIESLVDGAEVWGYCDGALVRTRVIATTQSQTAEPFVCVGDLKLTGNHPVWTGHGQYIDASQLSAGMSVKVLVECNHDADLGDLYTGRPEDQRSPIRGCHVSDGSTAAQRTSVSGANGGPHAPRLLDSFLVDGGRRAAGDRDTDWHGARVAGCRESPDSGAPENGAAGERDERRRWDAGSGDLSGNAAENIGAPQGHEVSAWSRRGNDGAQPHCRGAGEDQRCRERAHAVASDKGCAVGREHWPANVFGTSQETIRNEARDALGGSAPPQDRGIHDDQEAGNMHGDGGGIPVRHGCREGTGCQRAVGISVNTQGLPLQREADGVRAARTVYNFATVTGNYFADGVLVHNCDLGARHVWLMAQRERLGGELSDPDWPGDAKVAGWWLWGQCAWIGSGWCEWYGKEPTAAGDAGQGIQAIGKVPHISNAGQGIQAIGKVPHPSSEIPADMLTSGGRTAWVWLHRLTARLERVRVLHGEWNRCLNHTYGTLGSPPDRVGVFLDPPYKGFEALYSSEKPTADEACEWAREHADLRIALCGLIGDYDLPGWDVLQWSRPSVGFNGSSKTKHSEVIWFSPACLFSTAKRKAAFVRAQENRRKTSVK